MTWQEVEQTVKKNKPIIIYNYNKNNMDVKETDQWKLS